MNYETNNQVILRQLTGLEALMDVDQHKGCVINPRIFIIESKINLFEKRDDFFNALRFWMQIHPLLKTKITTKHIFDNNRNETMMKKYFEPASNEKLESFENVAFLDYQSNVDTNKDDAWKLIFEYELTKPLDSSIGPLWRIKILKISYDSTLKIYKYAFFLTLHHALTDGRNAYAIAIELFELIEKVYLKEELIISQQQMERAEYEINFPNDPRLAEMSRDFEYTPPETKQKDIIVPNFLKPKDSSSNDVDSYLSHHNGTFYTSDGKYFMSTSDILQSRKHHHCRLRFLPFDEDMVSKLLSKSKQMGVKLTGCLEVILCIALYKVYHFYSEQTFNLDTIKYKVTMSLRGLWNEPIDPCMMGLWMCSHTGKINCKLFDINSENFWSSKFWELSKIQSNELHKYLESRVYFDKDHLENGENQIYKLIKGHSVDDVHAYFAVTNLGQMNSKSANSHGLINIKEYYSALSYTEHDFWHFAFNSITTIDKRLYWCLAFNGKLLRPEVVDQWIIYIKEIVEKLVAVN